MIENMIVFEMKHLAMGIFVKMDKYWNTIIQILENSHYDNQNLVFFQAIFIIINVFNLLSNINTIIVYYSPKVFSTKKLTYFHYFQKHHKKFYAFAKIRWIFNKQ